MTSEYVINKTNKVNLPIFPAIPFNLGFYGNYLYSIGNGVLYIEKVEGNSPMVVLAESNLTEVIFSYFTLGNFTVLIKNNTATVLYANGSLINYEYNFPRLMDSNINVYDSNYYPLEYILHNGTFQALFLT